jgi:hypothetical protein
MPSAVGYQPSLASEMAAFRARPSWNEGSLFRAAALVPRPSARQRRFLRPHLKIALSLAAKAIYPAVDPFLSSSTLLDPGFVSGEHYRAASGVKQLLQRYSELQDIIAILGLEELSDADRLSVSRLTSFSLEETVLSRLGAHVPALLRNSPQPRSRDGPAKGAPLAARPVALPKHESTKSTYELLLLAEVEEVLCARGGHHRPAALVISIFVSGAVVCKELW